MTINSIKDLEKLLKMLRGQGVKTFSFAGINLELNDTIAPVALKRPGARLRQIKDPTESFPPHSVDENISIPQMDIPDDGLSEEDLLYYSASQQEG